MGLSLLLGGDLAVPELILNIGVCQNPVPQFRAFILHKLLSCHVLNTLSTKGGSCCNSIAADVFHFCMAKSS